MPAITFSDIAADVFDFIAGAIELPDSPYVDILENLDLSEFDEKLLTYIELTRAFMAEITSDVEARKMRTAVAKMMAAMSQSPGTYSSDAVPPVVGTAVPNIAALTDTDQMHIIGIGSVSDSIQVSLNYDLGQLGDGQDPPETLDELVDFMNHLIDAQGGDGFGNFFEFFNAGNGFIGLRLGDVAISRHMSLVIQETGSDGSTSMMAKLGLTATSRDNPVRERAADACRRALAPYLTTLRYLPPPEEGGGGEG